MNKPNIPGIISEAKRSERERIIKLLEENLEGVMRFSNANVKTPSSPEVVMSSFTGDIIALIKGENK